MSGVQATEWQDLPAQMESHLHTTLKQGEKGISLRIFVTDCRYLNSKRATAEYPILIDFKKMFSFDIA